MLTKNVPRSYVPGTAGVPASPGTPAIPAWDEVIPAAKQVVSPAYYVATLSPRYNPLTGQYEAFVPSSAKVVGTNSRTGTQAPSTGGSMGLNPPRPRDIVVHHPAVAAVPPTPGKKATKGQWMARNGLDWNAGAYSITRRSDDVETVFKVPEAVGVVIGFTVEPTKQNYRLLKHALYFHTNFVSPFENGVSVGPTVSYAAADTWRIRRSRGVVTYAKNGTEFYTSLIKSTGSLVVEAVLYGPLDRVD